jgi:hypothetical protein
MEPFGGSLMVELTGEETFLGFMLRAVRMDGEELELLLTLGELLQFSAIVNGALVRFVREHGTTMLEAEGIITAAQAKVMRIKPEGEPNNGLLLDGGARLAAGEV